MTRLETTEKQFRQMVIDACKLFGWAYYFTWNSLHSPAGFPDLVLVKGDRLIFAELKSDKGKVSEVQRLWLCDLIQTKTEVYIWRPGDMEEIIGILRGGKHG